MPAISKLDSLNGKTRRERKTDKRLDEDRAWEACKKAVDKRDGLQCRVCGKRVSFGTIGLEHSGIRHHLIYRSGISVSGGRHESWNVLTVCGGCNDDMHIHGTLRLEGDANVRDMVTFKFCGVQVSRYTESGWKVERVC
jgi:5-methylcytosine-specific restriction endonuclease McrA